MPRLRVVSLAGHTPAIGHRHRLLGKIAEEVPGSRVVTEDRFDLVAFLRRAATVEKDEQPVEQRDSLIGQIVLRHRWAPWASISFPSTHCRRVACSLDNRL